MFPPDMAPMLPLRPILIHTLQLINKDMAAANQALGSDGEEYYVAFCAALTIIYANLDDDDAAAKKVYAYFSSW